MNPIRKFFGKFFNFKQPAKVAPPKDEHFTISLGPPSESFTKKLIRRIRLARQPKQRQPIGKVGIGHGMHRLKHICGHPVRPFKRAQKRDLEKYWGCKVL